jgi:hypothetical protein
MALDADPYRTLGLPRGAPLSEVKKAYRRLAKEHHPDAAGEAALPRFLAIQAAYDQIAGPGASATGGAATGRGSPAPKRPWDADPDRANATHRAYGGRSRRTRTSGPRPRSAAGSGPGPGASTPGSGEAARPPNKATLGSTSYDGAGTEGFEPDWGGASWYGTTSGTYWTLNPKEYADPRKHGPEYQARARRAASARGAEAEAVLEGSGPGDPPVAGVSGSTGTPPPTHTTTSWWDATTGPESPAEDGSATPHPLEGADPAPGPSGSAGPAATRAAWASGWDWLEGGHPGLASRLARAVLGWVPVALAIGWAAGELTGCGRFAAECDTAAAGSAWLLQLGALIALLLLPPRVASALAIAALAALVAAVPAALLLASTGEGGAGDTSGTILGGLLVIAWIAGLALALGRSMRRGPSPVS